MRSINSQFAAGCAALLAAFPIAIGAQGPARPDSVAADAAHAQVAAYLERIIQGEMRDKSIPALSIALVEGHRIVWARGFGDADSAHHVPATAETVYRVGSVSKLFTDVGIMQLVEQQRVDLDAPVSRYLAGLSPHESVRHADHRARAHVASRGARARAARGQLLRHDVAPYRRHRREPRLARR